MSAPAKSPAAKTPKNHSKPKVPAVCPMDNYGDMLTAAVIELEELVRYIQARYKYKIGDNTNSRVKTDLKKGVADGTFKQAKRNDVAGSFSADDKKVAAPQKKPAAKKAPKK